MKRISSHLRSMNVNGQPAWFTIGGRRHADVPQYKEDITYSRKVRYIYTSTGTTINITSNQINTAVFGSIVPFSRVCVTEIQAWSDATADSFIRVTPLADTVQGDAYSDKSFSDVGTINSSRPYVHVRISPKDAAFMTVVPSPVQNVVTVIAPPGRVILDFMCLFSGTAGAPQI